MTSAVSIRVNGSAPVPVHLDTGAPALAIDQSYAHCADWAGKRNIRNGQRSRCAVHRQNIGIIFTVGTEQN